MSTRPHLKVKLDDPRAVLPTKGTPYGSYDITAISIEKTFPNRTDSEGNIIKSRTIRYNTGLIIQPSSDDYEVELLPRSSLSNTGCVMTNSIGLIDYDYRGRLLITLTKVDESFEDLTLPFTKFQVRLRKRIPFDILQVEEVEQTERGVGGFGSTDIQKKHNKPLWVDHIFGLPVKEQTMLISGTLTPEEKQRIEKLKEKHQKFVDSNSALQKMVLEKRSSIRLSPEEEREAEKIRQKYPTSFSTKIEKLAREEMKKDQEKRQEKDIQWEGRNFL